MQNSSRDAGCASMVPSVQEEEAQQPDKDNTGGDPAICHHV